MPFPQDLFDRLFRRGRQQQQEPQLAQPGTSPNARFTTENIPIPEGGFGGIPPAPPLPPNFGQQQPTPQPTPQPQAEGLGDNIGNTEEEGGGLTGLLKGLFSKAGDALTSPTAKGIYRGAAPIVKTAGPFVGTLLAGGNPAGGALGSLAGTGLSELLNYLGQEEAEGQEGAEGLAAAGASGIPEVEAQSELLQQMRQPFQGSFQPIAAEAQRRFQQEIIPSILQRFGSTGGVGSGAFRRQLAGAGQDLATRLASLGSQYGLQERGLEQQRQSGLGNYLSGQQGLGLQAQRLAQQGQNIGMQGLLGTGRLSGQLGQLGMERELAPWYYKGGSESGAKQALQGAVGGVNAGRQIWDLLAPSNAKLVQGQPGAAS